MILLSRPANLSNANYGFFVVAQIEELQGGIFHFVGIFVGMGFFRSSINLINTVLYKSDSIPIEATELTKTAFCELNLMELGQILG